MDEKFDPNAILKQHIVRDVDIPLEPGEVCLFCSKGQLVNGVTQTVKTTSKPGLGLGIVVPVTSHIGIGIGKRRVKTTTTVQNHVDKTSIEFYFCSRRYIIKMKKKPYEIRFSTVKAAKFYSDGLELWFGDNMQYCKILIPKSNMKQFNFVRLIIEEGRKRGIKIDIEDK